MHDLKQLSGGRSPQEDLLILQEYQAQFDLIQDPPSSIARQQEALALLIPYLRDSKPAFFSNAPEHQARYIALEIIQRFTFGEALKSQALELSELILLLLQTDNEEIGCLCLKIFIDLHKAYKVFIEKYVQLFLDIVLKIYQGMPETVRSALSPSQIGHQTKEEVVVTRSPASEVSPALQTPRSAESHEHTNVLAKSMSSFKVLTECPIIIVLLFSTYRQIVQTNLVQFTPAIIDMLSLQGNTAGSKTLVISPDGEKHRVFADFLLAQIKTLSFLAYVLRGFTTFMRKYSSIIPQFVIRLLQDCPSDMSAARKVSPFTRCHANMKELLVAARHILSTDFRTSFIDKIELLLDERVLVGTGVTAKETLR